MPPTPQSEVRHLVRDAVINLREASRHAGRFDRHLAQHLVAASAQIDAMTQMALADQADAE